MKSSRRKKKKPINFIVKDNSVILEHCHHDEEDDCELSESESLETTTTFTLYSDNEFEMEEASNETEERYVGVTYRSRRKLFQGSVVLFGTVHNVEAESAKLCAIKLNILCEENDYPLLNPCLQGEIIPVLSPMHHDEENEFHEYFCVHRHKLQRNAPALADDWVCDGTDFPGGCESGCKKFADCNGLERWNCSLCNFDLCEKCAMKYGTAKNGYQFSIALLPGSLGCAVNFSTGEINKVDIDGQIYKEGGRDCMVITQIDGAAFNVERLKKVAGGKEVYFAVLEFRKFLMDA